MLTEQEKMYIEKKAFAAAMAGTALSKFITSAANTVTNSGIGQKVLSSNLTGKVVDLGAKVMGNSTVQKVMANPIGNKVVKATGAHLAHKVGEGLLNRVTGNSPEKIQQQSGSYIQRALSSSSGSDIK